MRCVLFLFSVVMDVVNVARTCIAIASWCYYLSTNEKNRISAMVAVK